MMLQIIGTMPLPIGGVTRHIERLVFQLEKSNIEFSFFDYKRDSFFKGFYYFLQARFVHLHMSNVYGLLLISICGFLFRKRIIVTFHGNIGRFGGLRNLIEKIVLKIIQYPILLNKSSFKIAKSINTNAKLITAFIPPHKVGLLEDFVKAEIKIIKQSTTYLFCTNAFDKVSDKLNNEVYQITNLVKIFNNNPEYGLIISNPNGSYEKYFLNEGLVLNKNIFLISTTHDFLPIIEFSDCLIRYTLTDGDSISIHEALSLGKQVIASNVIDRPQKVIVVPLDLSDLTNAIVNFKKIECDDMLEPKNLEIIEYYKEILR